MHSLDMVAVRRFGLQYSGNRLTAQYSDKSYAESERQPIDQRITGREEQSGRIVPSELSSGDQSELQVIFGRHDLINDVPISRMLGRAETLVGHPHSFVAVDLKRRLSRKGSGSCGARYNRES